MTQSIKFTPAEPADLEEILTLINTINREWYSKIIPEEHFLDPFLTRKQFDEMAKVMEFYIHKKRGRIVAVGSFGTRNEDTAWIPLMHVHSKYQRQGIGSALLSFLEKKAKHLNFTKVRLETDSDAEWAVSFYKKHGYSIFEKNKNPWGYHVWLEKVLV
ncbi:MAG: GNAT family N-acetyltransferase [Candidatus Thorarchaeota archaeon]